MASFAVLDDVSLYKNKVLVRADLNVPLKNGRVSDDTRIRASLPTIKYLLRKNCAVIVCSHLGRPKGFDKSLRLNPVAKKLGELLKRQVIKLDDCIGEGVERTISAMRSQQVCVLENLRFHKGEEKNSPAFAKALAKLADVYVNDAFGSSHRAHASIVGIPNLIPGCAGRLLEKEIKQLSKALKPKKPFVLVVGGAKVEGKKKLIKKLAKKADKVLVGSAIAPELKRPAKNVVLPEDFVVAKNKKAKTKIVPADEVPSSTKIFDVGPKTVKKYVALVKNAKTVVWNGPLGLFESAQFAKGTKEIARAIARLKTATTVVCGGDTAAAVRKFGLAKSFTHVSTGGGAALVFLQGKKLPGIAALEESKKKFLKR